MHAASHPNLFSEITYQIHLSGPYLALPITNPIPCVCAVCVLLTHLIKPRTFELMIKTLRNQSMFNSDLVWTKHESVDKPGGTCLEDLCTLRDKCRGELLCSSTFANMLPSSVVDFFL